MNAGIVIIVVVLLISTVSHSYQTDALLSILMLIPSFFLHLMYIRNRYKKMGTQLIGLKKTSSEGNSLRTNLVLTLVVSIIITVLTYLYEQRIAISWLSFFALLFLEYSYLNRFLRKSIMENGICFDNYLIEWDRIQSYKWVNPHKKQKFTYLSISYKTIFFHGKSYLNVLSDQKEEIDGFFRKMIKS